MNEVLLGYAEGGFLLLAIVVICWIALRVFDPRERKAMEAHARIPFSQEDDNGRA
ncbi:hypothetical protein LQG66_26055 [Bradyrhizobium ontarionense]|uniref:CcoQ/FixQ family Cbb3-type cytochrome c oxidase assembly chaperone n=1 Tax=Bradyrhizobium ontarionense TaxID=2898149 RepID=A0ABY3R731_9BRAD|nr:hypothetical protein [Bradyrhizobium sp. A19]UFZ02715.1 hypothetical protein LQG66_26055 [Bradyrhizobium sp. A19]